MYLVWINPPTNFTFSDDSVFLKKNLGGGHKFSEFACLKYFSVSPVAVSNLSFCSDSSIAGL